MSGGYFDYTQFRLNDAVDQLKQLVDRNDSTERDEYGDQIGHHYSPETIDEIHCAIELTKLAAMYIHRIDWLVSGDDGEETFHERLLEDIENLERVVEERSNADV